MITVLTGENSFEIQRALQQLSAQFDGLTEKVDGTGLELSHLPDLFTGGTLFAANRLIVIRDLAQNATVWEKIPEWIPRIPEEIHIVLVDEKLDKRTSTYKTLKKDTDLREYPAWSDRDWAMADAWVLQEAKRLDITLDKKLAHHIVERVGMDQWQLLSALEKLSLVDTISVAVIDEIIDPKPSENVFQLFELALEGSHQRIHEMLRTIELSEEPYRLFALLSSQAFQLAAIASAGEGDNPAKDFGIHPYVAGKLARYGKKIGPNGVKRVIEAFAKADADMKLSKGDPWLLIERALMSVG
jgi:DNA polymerase III delta subunit